MRNSTKLMALSIALETTTPQQGQDIAERISGTRASKIIKLLNKWNEYWFQKTSKVREPIPNMGPRREPGLIDWTEDVIKEGLWPAAFVAFMLKATETSSLLTLYVEDGPFGFYPVFSIRIFSLSDETPYLIKFTKTNLSPEQYDQMIALLYSKKNVWKHFIFGLKKRQPLNSYEY